MPLPLIALRSDAKLTVKLSQAVNEAKDVSAISFCKMNIRQSESLSVPESRHYNSFIESLKNQCCVPLVMK
jgi:hypothetical protein